MIHGLHHVTAIAGDPQRNLDFYVGLLGLRLVKRTINFDDPGTYHFYFGDAVGTPGTILTFFPWPVARRGSRGVGEVEATAFAIPLDSINYWLERLREHHVAAERLPERFGAQVIRLLDADGMLLELLAAESGNAVQPWSEGSVGNTRFEDFIACRLRCRITRRRRHFSPKLLAIGLSRKRGIASVSPPLGKGWAK
jgi:glyoxalase family protein